ncbi:MAG: hypothetical protein ACHP9Z_04210 [Streptosporangiales bacterium]
MRAERPGTAPVIRPGWNGSRDFAVRDPEGNRRSFGSYRGEPRKG